MQRRRCQTAMCCATLCAPMSQAVTALNWATDAAFLLLAVASVRQYLRHPQRHRLDLAAAILLLTILAVIGRVTPLLPKSSAPLIGDVTIVLLLASAYAFLRFRADFIPLPRNWEIAIVAALALIAVYTLAVGLVGAGRTLTAPQELALVLLTGA